MEIFIFCVWLIGLVASVTIGQVRGRIGFGFCAGFLLGPFGVVVTGFMPYGTEKCYYCHGWCYKKATTCQNCGRDYPSKSASESLYIDPMKM